MIHRSARRHGVDATGRSALAWALLGIGLCLPSAAPAMAAQDQAAADCHPAPAGEVPEIRIGSCVRATLRSDAPNTNAFQDYRLPLQAGDTVQIDMDAVPTPQAQGVQAQAVYTALDTYLELRQRGRVAPVAENDDRPGSLNSRIVFTAREAGDYIVRARGFAGQTGDYTLAVTSVRPPPPPVPFAGDRAEGTVTHDDPASTSRPGYRWVSRSFDSAGPDARMRIGMQASAADGHVALIGPDGTTLATAQLETEPVSIVTALHVPGRYTLRVELPEGDPPPHYVLSLERGRNAAAPPPTPIRIGRPAEIVLDLDSPLAMQEGNGAVPDFFYRLYVLPVQAGQILTVSLDAPGPPQRPTRAITRTALDPVLDVGTLSPIGFAVARTDDDGGPGLNSRMVIHAERAGLLYLRARTLGLGLGRLRLSVAPGEVPLPSDAD